MSYIVKLGSFEGPLDLLLHLAGRLEVDLYHIPMAAMTAQYIEHLHAMNILELDEASEYLVMAATLLSIKSQMLLPPEPVDSEADEGLWVEDEPDPRDELVRRLVEYRKYKGAARLLQHAAEERRLYVSRTPMSEADGTPPSPACLPGLAEAGAGGLLEAYQTARAKRRIKRPVFARVARQEISIRARMADMLAQLAAGGGRLAFSAFSPGGHPSASEQVAAFLSLLELMKRQRVEAEQRANFEELFIQLIERERADIGQPVRQD